MGDVFSKRAENTARSKAFPMWSDTQQGGRFSATSSCTYRTWGPRWFAEVISLRSLYVLGIQEGDPADSSTTSHSACHPQPPKPSRGTGAQDRESQQCCAPPVLLNLLTQDDRITKPAQQTRAHDVCSLSRPPKADMLDLITYIFSYKNHHSFHNIKELRSWGILYILYSGFINI